MALDWIETFYGLDNIPSRVTDTSHQLLRFVVSYNAKYLDEKIREAVKNCV
ncbi:unnamed protein product [Anisakis simplex]|uniref:Transposase n=1 Tax=Anisakis simplex TaxID=6269 RepID=A0A0M3JNV9_ANISI|nr:unnamed protein product [Anisakis simplex]